MKKTVITVAAAALAILCIASSAPADTYTSPAGTIRAGVNYFSLPAIPSSTNPTVIFAGVPIDGKISYWCRQTQHWLVYPADWGTPPTTPWHMGFKLEADQDYTISFQGAQPTTERSTCLNPLVAGFACISQPYDHEAYWSDFRISSDKIPGVKYTSAQAVANGWIEPYLIEGAQDSGAQITLDGAGGTSRTVKPWRAYWVQTKVAPTEHKLTIYWSMNPVPEPSSMLALGAGLMGLAGFVIRRRR